MKLRSLGTIDWTLIILPIFLVAFGVAILFSFSFVGQKNLALFALVYALLGIIAMIFLSFLDYRTFKGVVAYLYIVNILLLLLVYFVGAQVFGAKRWLDFGFFQLQPSELIKLVVILFVAKFLSNSELVNWRRLIGLTLIVGLPVLLILRQPDLGTAGVILVAAAVMLAYAKTPRRFWLVALIAVLIAAPLSWSALKTYQKQRIYTFLNPGSDPSGVGYNVTQAKIAIGSGGIWGRGLGQGSQSQLNFLPAAHTDFIFSAIGESVGFVGSMIVVLLFTILIWRGLQIATISQDDYGYFVALGIATMFLMQALVNIGMNLSLLPVTGIPLPFVSFGGSGMLTNFAAVGILQSIYIRHKKIRFG